jgi:hypothetical protein
VQTRFNVNCAPFHSFRIADHLRRAVAKRPTVHGGDGSTMCFGRARLARVINTAAAQNVMTNQPNGMG